MIIDTHCHLYLSDYEADIEQVMDRASQAGVGRFYLPAIDSGTTAAMLSLEGRYKDTCSAMMGLHPCSVNERVEEELAQVQQWLVRRSFAAIGEIGLDFYHDTRFKDQQYGAFRTQIEWALEYDLPIVIHSRNSMWETIGVIKEYAGRGLTGIFHCFSGDEAAAREIIAAGFYLGIGGVLTYKNAGLAPVIEEIPLEHLVLETDAPYLAPVPFRGKRNESAYLVHIIDRLAALKGVTKADIAAVTTANAKKIFCN